MKKIFVLAGGWTLVAVGAALSPLPVPLPVGITTCLIGCAILTTHSKTFRRGVQYVRHHNSWMSHTLEAITARAPSRVKTMVHLTRPLAFGRRARMRARRASELT